MRKRSEKGEQLLERERMTLTPASGGGVLSYEVWGLVVDGRTTVTRYNLAYVNPLIFPGDNGRVLGYDNAHDGHHRHYMGKTEPVQFNSFEDTLERFQKEWQAIVHDLKLKRSQERK